MEKRRSADLVGGKLLAGDVSGATVLVVDDLIASGGTLLRAAEACRERGAARVIAIAAHGIFVGDASATLASPALARTIISDSVPPFRLAGTPIESQIDVVSAVPSFAEIISRCHQDLSLSGLVTESE